MGRVSDARERLIAATIDLLWARSHGAVTVDDICARAKVQRGTFYHFFKSKDDLVLQAIQADWERRKAQLDALFSPTVPPLERLRGCFAAIRERQRDLQQRLGCVVGPLYSKIGQEVGPATEIGQLVQRVLQAYARYFESALRDAAAEGAPVGDPVASTRALIAYLEGLAGQARIQNDLSLFDHVEEEAFGVLGLHGTSLSRAART